MTQEEKVNLCLKCRYKKFDLEKGLLCNKTGLIADFDEECVNYWDENLYSKKGNDISEIQSIESGRKITILVYSFLFIFDSISIVQQIISNSIDELLFISLGVVIFNLFMYLAIFVGFKWAKNTLSLFNLFIIISAIFLIFVRQQFIYLEPRMITKLISSIVLNSITFYYINFNSTFLQFFNFQNKKYHYSL